MTKVAAAEGAAPAHPDGLPPLRISASQAVINASGSAAAASSDSPSGTRKAVPASTATCAACAPAADLILSGILAGQGAAVCEAYRTEFEVLHSAVREDWCRLHLRLRAPRAGENETVP